MFVPCTMDTPCIGLSMWYTYWLYSIFRFNCKILRKGICDKLTAGLFLQSKTYTVLADRIPTFH